MNIGDRIHYSGDMANLGCWAKVVELSPTNFGMMVRLKEEGADGREFLVHDWQIGEVYKGHCNPRFVTEQAFNTFRQEQIKALKLRMGGC